MKKLINTSFVYMILGLFFGLFYREYTNILNFTGDTVLSVLHTHTLILGMFFFLIVSLFGQTLKITEHKKFNKFFISYNVGVVLTIAFMLMRGITDVHLTVVPKGLDTSISGMSGIAHIVLTVGLFYFFSVLRDTVKDK